MDRTRALRQLRELKKHGRHMRLAAEEWKEEWQTLIAIILSARTRDEVTIEVCKGLFEKYPTLDALAEANIHDVENHIRRVNFYRNKSNNIVACAGELIEKLEGKVPHTLDALILLSGVGRKTANVFLSEYNHEAIGVDTHVSYISQRLGWVTSTRPDIIEKELESLFPRKYWSSINLYLVRFGKTYISRKKKNLLLDEIGKL